MSSDQRLIPEQLLVAAREADADAVGELLESYRHYLKLLAELQIDGQLQAKVDASDIVQQTFLEAYQGFADFRGSTERELMAWLRRILVHNLVDYAKRHYGRQSRNHQIEVSLHEELDRSSRAMDRELVGDQTTPSQAAARREQAVLLADALEQLPDDYRTVLILRHLKGLKFPEVAQRMGRTVGGVQQLWARAVAELRRQIGGQQ